MVDFGPRLRGYETHDQFCTGLADEFVAAGLELQPCHEYVYDCWQPQAFGLKILDAAATGPIDVATTGTGDAVVPYETQKRSIPLAEQKLVVDFFRRRTLSGG